MPGTVAITPQVRWSAASWLFDLTVNTLAAEVPDPALAAVLRDIVGENLGWFAVHELTAVQRAEITTAAEQRLLTDVADKLPPALAERSRALSLVADLVQLLRSHPPT
jgi:hypothetical protein